MYTVGREYSETFSVSAFQVVPSTSGYGTFKSLPGMTAQERVRHITEQHANSPIELTRGRLVRVYPDDRSLSTETQRTSQNAFYYAPGTYTKNNAVVFVSEYDDSGTPVLYVTTPPYSLEHYAAAVRTPFAPMPWSLNWFPSLVELKSGYSYVDTTGNGLEFINPFVIGNYVQKDADTWQRSLGNGRYDYAHLLMFGWADVNGVRVYFPVDKVLGGRIFRGSTALEAAREHGLLRTTVNFGRDPSGNLRPPVFTDLRPTSVPRVLDLSGGGETETGINPDDTGISPDDTGWFEELPPEPAPGYGSASKIGLAAVGAAAALYFLTRS